MQKILLYYKFAPIADPEAVRLWQRALCEKLNLKGRILISTHGINGTVGGDIEDLKAYVKETKQFAAFKGTTFKWSEGDRDRFPKLSIKVRPELVGFGAPDEVQVDEHGVIGGGKHLSPEQVHKLVEERGDVVFFDGRNKHEAAVGKFKDAVVPDVETSKDFIRELESDKYNDIKDKPIVTYCTGGIRCEVISAMMKKRGFKEVYQIDGGIVKYGEKYGDDGLWEGKLYVFDGRLVTQFSDKAKDIGHCIHCDNRTSDFINCANNACNNLVLVCGDCRATQTTCSDDCRVRVGAEIHAAA
ncbi:MAG TPA: rhodanese-related sulfurtransferase [Candidatus Saccharimonadales bacterium]|nr:rhodanese-related sulfurtransferase [Candidatus Saccharimonadales bacterium]